MTQLRGLDAFFAGTSGAAHTSMGRTTCETRHWPDHIIPETGA